MHHVNVYRITRAYAGVPEHDGWIDVGKFEETVGAFDDEKEADSARLDAINRYMLGKGRTGDEAYYVLIEDYEGRDFPA